MDTLKRGTPCFLVGLNDAVDFIGRPVEVVFGPMSVPGDADELYLTTSVWSQKLFNGSLLLMERKNLLPFGGPASRDLIEAHRNEK
jgi:hypothetical protein